MRHHLVTNDTVNEKQHQPSLDQFIYEIIIKPKNISYASNGNIEIVRHDFVADKNQFTNIFWYDLNLPCVIGEKYLSIDCVL